MPYYDDEENPIVTKLRSVADAVKTQAVDAYNQILEGELYKDRDIITTGILLLASIFFASKVLFGASVGYVVYHLVRRDDHVRAALLAAEEERAATKTTRKTGTES